MKLRIISALVMGIALMVAAQDAIQLQPEKFNDYALNYYLPKTTTEIEFVASTLTSTLDAQFLFNSSLSLF